MKLLDLLGPLRGPAFRGGELFAQLFDPLLETRDLDAVELELGLRLSELLLQLISLVRGGTLRALGSALSGEGGLEPLLEAFDLLKQAVDLPPRVSEVSLGRAEPLRGDIRGYLGIGPLVLDRLESGQGVAEEARAAPPFTLDPFEPQGELFASHFEILDPLVQLAVLDVELFRTDPDTLKTCLEATLGVGERFAGLVELGEELVVALCRFGERIRVSRGLLGSVVLRGLGLGAQRRDRLQRLVELVAGRSELVLEVPLALLRLGEIRARGLA